MRKWFAVPILLMSLMAALLLSAANKSSDVEKTIEGMEHKWAEAQKVGDASVVAVMLARELHQHGR